MMSKPEQLWIVFTGCGDRIYRSKARAYARWEKDTDSDWYSEDMKEAARPVRYQLASHSGDRR